MWLISEEPGGPPLGRISLTCGRVRSGWCGCCCCWPTGENRQAGAGHSKDQSGHPGEHGGHHQVARQSLSQQVQKTGLYSVQRQNGSTSLSPQGCPARLTSSWRNIGSSRKLLVKLSPMLPRNLSRFDQIAFHKGAENLMDHVSLNPTRRRRVFCGSSHV